MLQKLQEQMNLSFAASSISSNSSAYVSLLQTDNVSSFISTTPSMSSASSSSSASSTTWPTAVPQIQTAGNVDMFKTKREQEFWDLRNFPVNNDFCDDLNHTKYPLPIGNNSASQIKQKNLSGGGSTKTNSSIFDATDEHHISFSKNGTEVDFENDFIDGLSNSTASLSINAPPSISSDFLTVPNFYNDRFYEIYGYSDGFSDDGGAIKTRRSNSLTTPTASGNFSSSSAENLANLQKPRSFSLSMESSRNVLMSCGSETRLDDYNKLTQLRMNNSNQVGMGNIAVWLKSLRLHKYLWLFTNMTYEQMMEITEEYLENLGVTKGARHKLVLCIQKLVERVAFLKQLEKELMDGSRPLKSGMDELANIVLTPMKPINSVPCEEDVAAQIMRIMDCGMLKVLIIYLIDF
jgi:PHAT/SAM domain (Sterile alpha motif)